jgi:hypothetical protein
MVEKWQLGLAGGGSYQKTMIFATLFLSLLSLFIIFA